MTDKAKQLLKNMASEYDKTGNNSFDSMFYIEFSNSVINELEMSGYITIKNDIIGSIALTNNGYQEAKN